MTPEAVRHAPGPIRWGFQDLVVAGNSLMLVGSLASALMG